MFMRRVLPIAVLLTLVLALGASAGVVSAQTEATQADVEAKFSGWNALDAIAAGYQSTPECVAEPGLGTMGFYYANFGLLAAPIDPINPPVVLVDGGGSVVAVEYLVAIGPPDSLIPDPAPPAPVLFGQTFDGPMAGHEGLPPHYALHMWLINNPGGQFSAFNSSPALSCPVLGGSVSFRDADALSDSVVTALTAVPDPAAGTQYEGWLIADDGSKVSTGVMSVSGGAINMTYTDPNGANLLATYSSFAISLEPAPDPDPDTPALVLYTDTVLGAVFVHVGHLVVAWPPNPDGKGIAVGLREQVATALFHAELAASSTTLETQQLHLHHVINIIESSSGANYDASFGDPGDGLGVLNYANDAIVHANLAKAGAPDDENIVAHADGVIASANNVINNVTTARDNALLGVAQTTDNRFVSTSLTNAVTFLMRARDGTDDDGDDAPGSTGAEGGALRAYLEAQDIASFMPASETAVVVATPTPDAPVTGDIQPGSAIGGMLVIGLLLVAAGAVLLLRRRAPVL